MKKVIFVETDDELSWLEEFAPVLALWVVVFVLFAGFMLAVSA